MMKRFLPRLSFWWFATMTPVYSPLTTIHAREKLRKRRLLSLIVLISLPITLLTIPLGFFVNISRIQLALIYLLCATLLLTLWINQRGYLILAGLFYLFSSSSIEMLFISNESLDVPVFFFYLWPMLLISLVSTGFFLPAWGPLLLSGTVTLFMCWFMLFERPQQIAIYIPDPHIRLGVLIFACIIITIIALFSAIFTATTDKAVIGADRAAELEQAHQALADAYSGMETANEKLEVALARIQKQALTDALTDLPNHRAIMDQLTKELERAQRDDHPLSILFFDADHFKQINDTYGHATGDAVLRQIGRRANNVLRSGDTLGRFGGEEFVILLPKADASEASAIAERIRAVIAAEPIVTPEVEESVTITVSIGLSTYPRHGTSEQALLSQADEAMYSAKRLGRNQVSTATEGPQMHGDTPLRKNAVRSGNRSSALNATY